MEFEYIFSGVSGLFFFYYIFIAIRRMSSISRARKILGSANALTGQSEVGDYVLFSGRLSTPRSTAPIINKPSGYWGLIVKAVFSTKKKKPNKGMQVHRPVIFKASSDDAPFMVSNGELCAQMGFTNHLEMIVNPQVKTKETKSRPPIDDLLIGMEDIWKPKYSSYESKIYTLPEKSSLTIWGTVKNKSVNSFILAGDKKNRNMPLIYRGSKQNLLKTMSNQFYSQLFVLVWSSLLMLSILGWFQGVVDVSIEVFVAFMVFGGMVSLVVSKRSKPTLGR